MSALAVDGGTPVRSTMLPYGRQSLDENGGLVSRRLDLGLVGLRHDVRMFSSM